MKTLLPMVVKKECGTCTKCCEGWLHADIRGHEMYPGKPCFFIEIGKGCKDYENRPQEPCKNFTCGWLEIESMPEEFKPEVSGVIMHLKETGGNSYIVLSKAPNDPTVQYLSWAIQYAMSKGIGIIWYIDDQSWWLGNSEFSKQMELDHPKKGK
jgi:hypothetical protein